ncbi:MAG: tetratricopeptide repeat protein [Bacteroidota bacterium]
MKKILPFFFLTLLWSCGNGDARSKIAQLEQEHSKTPTTEIKQQLLASYKSYLNELTISDTFNLVANKAAAVAMDLNQYQEATAILTDAIKNHPTGAYHDANVGMLCSVLLYHVHADDFGEAVSSIKGVYAPPTALRDAFEPIMKKLAEDMLDEKTGQWNQQKVTEYIAMARLQAAVVVKDQAVQKSLFDAASIANTLKRHDDALTIYDYILAHPEDFSKVSSALFLKGYTYDEHLKDMDKARALYEEFLEKYPDDQVAESVRASLNNLGKSAAEILQSFEKK